MCQNVVRPNVIWRNDVAPSEGSRKCGQNGYSWMSKFAETGSCQVSNTYALLGIKKSLRPFPIWEKALLGDDNRSRDRRNFRLAGVGVDGGVLTSRLGDTSPDDNLSGSLHYIKCPKWSNDDPPINSKLAQPWVEHLLMHFPTTCGVKCYIV